MAVWTTCPNCKKDFSAQDTYLGKKVKCPSCTAKVEVLPQQEQKEKGRWLDEQQKRLELYEELERDNARPQSFSVEFGTGLDRVRNYNPGAVSRFRKLRALSRFMILCAYLLTGLIFGCGAVAVALFRDELFSIGVLVGIQFVLALSLVFSFCLFKFLGELSWLLADVGDHQLDVRNLLLDVRDDLDRVLAQRDRIEDRE